MIRKILTLCLTAFAILSCIKIQAQEYKNKTLETIHTRTSVRSYSDKPIEEEILLELVKAGMAAPTGMNQQPWEFIIITEREVLTQLANFKKMLNTAQAAIVVVGHHDPKKEGSIYWNQDCSAATQNILLAAHSYGLGAVWTTVYPHEDIIAQVRHILKMPDEVTALNIIPIGYPKEEQKPKDKYKKEKIHFNKW